VCQIYVKNSTTFAKLPFAEKANTAGIKVFHLPSNEFVGELTFETSVDELYDLQIIPNTNSVGILNTINEVHKHLLSIPNATFWAKLDE
jgi:hypothetical protein